MRSDTSVHIRHALSARNGPGEDANNCSSRDQWTAVVSVAISHAAVVISANVRVSDARTVGHGVRETAGSVAHGGLWQPLHDVGVVSGKLRVRRKFLGLKASSVNFSR